MADRDLSRKISLDASGFGQGVQQVREKLSQLNTELQKNKTAMKEANDEARKLEKQQKELADQMKDGGTDEQRKQMQELNDKLVQVNARIGQLKTNEIELKSEVKNATRELTEQKNGAGELADKLDSVSDRTAQAANAMNSFSGAIKAVIALAASEKIYGALIGSNAEMEQYMTSFTVMLGDAEKAQKLMNELTEMAAKTPMELTDVVSAGTLLMNYGVEAENLIETMTRLGDLASGDAVKFERVSLAYGQMLAKGKVTGEELKQMTEAGVPLLQALAETLGKTAGEVQDMVRNSQVSIDDLNSTIANLTTGTGQFAGMMEKQSQTFTGLTSTLSDELSQIGRETGEKAFEELKEGLQEVLDLLDQWRADGTLEDIEASVGEALGNLVSFLKDLLKWLVENKEAVVTFAAAFGGLKVISGVTNMISGAVTKVKELKAAFTLANGELDVTKIQAIGAGAAIAGLVAELTYYGKAIFDVSEDVKAVQRSVERLEESYADSIATNEAEVTILRKKTEEYENLRNKQDRTAEEEERLAALAESLQSTLGDEIAVINKETGAYNELTGAVEDYIAAKTKQIKLTAMEETAIEAYKKMAEIDRKIEKRSEEHRDYQNATMNPYDLSGNYNPARLLDWTGDVETNSFLNDTAKLREEKKKLYDEFIKPYEEALEEGLVVEPEIKVEAPKSEAGEEEDENPAVNYEEEQVDAFKAKAKELKYLRDMDVIDEKDYYEQLEQAKNEYLREGSDEYKDASSEIYRGRKSLEKSDTKSEKDPLVEAFKEEQKELDYQHDIGILNEQEYYDKLKKIRDKYLEESSDEYRTVTRKIVKYEGGTDERAFDSGKKELTHLLKMDEISEAEYYDGLQKLADQYLDEYSDKFKATEEEIYAYKKRLAEDAAKEAEELWNKEISDAEKALSEASKARIKQLDNELEKKKQVRDETLKAIDDEVRARRRLKEDQDIDRQIDSVRAQLNYGRLDEFSQKQLERQLSSLQEKKADAEWERGIEDQKETANSEYEEAKANTEKMKEDVQSATEAVKETFEAIKENYQGINEEMKAVVEAIRGLSTTTNNTSANINFNNSGNLTADQIAKAVVDVLGVTL